MRTVFHRWVSGNRRALAVLYLLALCATAYSLLSLYVMHASVIRYVSQAGGSFTGGSACNGQTAISVATFNATSNGAGDHDFLCGTISSAVVPTGNGGSGSPVTITFDVGASIQMPALPTSGGLNLSGLSHYLIDGGGGSCGFVSFAVATCSVGAIESTANGTGQPNQIASVGINANSTTDVEIKGLLIGPIYTHTSPTDTSQSPPGPLCVSLQGAATINIHNDTMHDAAWCLTGTVATLTVQSSELYNTDHGLGFGGANSSFTVSGNYFHDWVNWDQGSTFHHDGIHLWASNGLTFNGATVCNNLFGGDQGSSVTAAIYNEQQSSTGTIENITDCNNVVLVHAGRVSCCGWISFYTTVSGGTATGGSSLNNTILGSYTAGTGACLDSVGWLLIRFENNNVTGCQNLITVDVNSTVTAINGNEYENIQTDQGCGLSCNTYSWHGTITPGFAAWQTNCGCDAAGRSDTLAAINVNPTGRQLTGSTLIGNGLNLTSLSITPLDSDILGNARPGGATAWDIGAYFGAAAVPSGFTITPSGGACAALGC